MEKNNMMTTHSMVNSRYMIPGVGIVKGYSAVNGRNPKCGRKYVAIVSAEQMIMASIPIENKVKFTENRWNIKDLI
jgi:hypothetical protein